MIRYLHLNPVDVNANIASLRAVYLAVFSLPPYNEGPKMADKFVEWVSADSKLPGFSMVGAYNEDRLVGFTYGYTKPPGDWWSGTNMPIPTTIKAAEKFAVMEWAVLPGERGKGIGRRLLEEILADRHEPYATLTVNPAADARTIYERLGWRHVASTRPGKMPGMDVMLRELSAEVA
jgi:GNAT superfamily N-acetyltransferase